MQINCIANLVTVARKKMKILLNSASIKHDELLKITDSIEQACDVCLKYKKQKLKPVAGVALSKDYNDAVAFDLIVINKTNVLHTVDHVRIFSATTVVKSKKKEQIAEPIIKKWIAIFGATLSDNGWEFNNGLFRKLGEQFNITVKSRTAESPCPNEIERHNTVFSNKVKKLLLDSYKKYPTDVIVASVT